MQYSPARYRSLLKLTPGSPPPLRNPPFPSFFVVLGGGHFRGMLLSCSVHSNECWLCRGHLEYVYEAPSPPLLCVSVL